MMLVMIGSCPLVQFLLLFMNEFCVRSFDDFRVEDAYPFLGSDLLLLP